MYRAIGWKALRAASRSTMRRRRGAWRNRRGSIDRRVTIDGIDVTREIRTPEIDRAAAAVARLPGARRARRAPAPAGGSGGIVMEGRDIGTVVFPDADVKIYLDASAEERAWRRANDPAHTGGPSAVAEVATALTARDEIDRTRTASPFYAAADAVVIDTTGRSVDDVVALVMDVVRARFASYGIEQRAWWDYVAC